MSVTPWRYAWDRALLGPEGFYRRDAPAQHFRTSAAHARVLGAALAELVTRVHADLGRPTRMDVVDVGAGDGSLLAATLAALPIALASRLRPLAVEVRPRPPGLDPRVAWLRGRAPQVLAGIRRGPLVGLVMAHEWLDTVPCDPVVGDGLDWRLVLVDPRTGRQVLGPRLGDRSGCQPLGIDGAALRGWLDSRGPGPPAPGRYVEVGLARDEAWRALVGSVAAGTAVAVDYASGSPPAPDPTGATLTGATLTGYRGGVRVPPVPDGSCDVTAHVDLASCAAAAAATGRVARTRLGSQQQVLAALGVDPRPPDPDRAVDDAAGFLADLERAGAAATLTDPGGLGAFTWLRQDLR